MHNKILTLKKMYIRKTKLTTEKKFINAHKRFFTIMFLIDKLVPNLLETRVAKSIDGINLYLILINKNMD